MILDYVETTGAFCLFVERDEGIDLRVLKNEHGWDVSTSASTPERACLFTRNQYLAASVPVEHMTTEAVLKLAPLIVEIEASWSLGSAAHIDVPEGVDLWPFQKAGVEYAMRRQHSLIGDEPGLGKTSMGIALANEMRAKRIIVVCPANIRLQWAKQIRVWSTMEKPIIYPILKGADGVHPRANWTILSYDLLRSEPIFSALVKLHYDLLILDEAHYLKTPSAQRTKRIFAEESLSARAGATLALTGTPLPNRPRECYTLARGLCWDSIDWMSEDAFQDRFNPSVTITRRDDEGRITKRFSKEEVGRLPELQARLRSSFMVRRLKRDVLTQLPDIRHEIVHVEEDGAVKKALKAESMLEIDPTDLSGLDASVIGHISVVRRQMGLAIAPHAADYVDMLIEGGEEKLVVFGWHLDVLNLLQDRLRKHGVIRVDGSTSPFRRQLAVDQFQSDPSTKIFLANLQAVGVGVDGLQNVCAHGVFAEASWTPSDNDQGVGRLERIGQQHGMQIDYLVAPGSFSERILGTSLKKARNVHAALDKEHY